MPSRKKPTEEESRDIRVWGPLMSCFRAFTSDLNQRIFRAATERAWSRRTEIPVHISAEDLVESARLVLPAAIVAELEQALQNYETTNVRNTS